MTEQANTELALPTINPEQYQSLYITGGLDPFYQQIREQVLSEVPDTTTKAGIARIKSLAAMVSKSKTAVEKPGREYLKQLKELPKVIEAELRDWNSKMDSLRDEVRQPVTELEEKEKARVAALDKRLSDLKAIAGQLETTGVTYQVGTDVIARWIGALEQIEIDGSWEEYKERAQVAKDAGLIELRKAHEVATEREAQQAEIEQLKAEQAKREQEERERQIAEKARVEAEQKALREKIEAEQREQAAKDAQSKAEQDAKDAQERLIREQEESAERERAAAEQAAERERQRIAQEEADRKAEEERRAANVEHQRTFNREVIADMQLALPNLSEADAITLLTAIVKRKVRHLSIQY